MKIVSNTKNFLRNYNEAKGIANNYKRIIKTGKVYSVNYLTNIFIVTIILLSLCIINIIFKELLLAYCFLIISITYLFLMITRILLSYSFYNYRVKTQMEINEDGVVYNSLDGLKVIFGYDKIDAVISKKYTVSIITNVGCFFFFDIKEKKKIIKEIKKYKKDVIVIE